MGGGGCRGGKPRQLSASQLSKSVNIYTEIEVTEVTQLEEKLNEMRRKY